MSELEFNVRVGAIDAQQEKHRRRRIYGRGFCDAARLAGREPGELMNEAKITRAEQALTAIATKVYDATPFDEPWSLHQILTEVGRVSGTHPDFRVLQGCIKDLIERHLVRETSPDHFVRLAPKRPTIVASIKKPAAAPAPSEATYVPPPAPISAAGTLEQLGDLSKRLRAFADEIDGVALGVAAQLQTSDAEAERFRQMKALLGGVH